MHCTQTERWPGHIGGTKGDRKEGREAGMKWQEGDGLTNVPPSQSALGNDRNTGKMSPKS